MPSDHDGHGPPGTGPHLDDGGEPGAISTDSGPASHWSTLESRLEVEVVKDRIRRALAPRQPFAYGAVLSGSETVRGFLFKFRAGSHVLVGEVDLAAWEGGTQVHVAAPREEKRRQYEVLVEWLGRVLG